MANHELTIPPVFNENLRKYETEDEVHADVFNAVENQLINNDSYLKSHIDTAEQNIKEHKETTDIHVTKAQKDSWTAKATTTEATTTTKGLMSSADKTKLNGITTGAEVNQNAFSNVKVGSNVVSANEKTATIEFSNGTNITIAADNATKKVTINGPSNVTTSTNGLMTKEDKIKLNNIATNANNYAHPTYTSKSSGLYKVTVDGTGHVSATSAVTKADITALGIPAQDTNTTYGVATTGALGLVKSGTDITVDASGNVSVVDDSHNHIISNVDGLQSALDAKAASSHTHSNYVNQNAFSNVTVGSTTIAADSATDTLTLTAGSNITLTPDATNDKITISATDTKFIHPSYTSKANGLYKVTVDATGHISATSAVTKADITNLGIPAQDTNTTYGVATTGALGLVKSGTDITVDASGNVSVVDDSHNHIISNVDGLQSALDAKAASSHTHSNYVNQNAFSNVAVGSTTIAADSTTDTLTLTAGSNVTITPDTTNDKITISATDTKFIHPTYPSKSNGLYKVTVDATGHVSATDLVTNIDIMNLGIVSKNYPVFEGCVSMGRKQGTAFGSGSTALGSNVEASGVYSHASGSNTTASGSYSHAEGNNTTASGNSSHAEGKDTKATEYYSHAEGSGSEASGMYSHVEGMVTKATGYYSHAEGAGSKASNDATHAEGFHTTSSNFASHASGKYNKAMLTGGKAGNKSGDVFVIGNGTSTSGLSNAFRITYAGEVYGLSAFQSAGADYAEYFEWIDGNAENEDRVGYFVTMEGNKIKKAESSEDYILGIVSAQPCIIGNSDEDWLGRWQHDEFGRFLKREVKTPVTKWKEVQENSDKEDEEPFFKLIEVETGEYVKGWDYVPNPDYDPNQTYTERKDRKEWSAIGMMGVLAVRDDGTCKVNGFCTVKEGGIATTTNDRNGYRVIERVTENIVKVVFR